MKTNLPSFEQFEINNRDVVYRTIMIKYLKGFLEFVCVFVQKRPLEERAKPNV